MYFVAHQCATKYLNMPKSMTSFLKGIIVTSEK